MLSVIPQTVFTLRGSGGYVKISIRVSASRPPGRSPTFVRRLRRSCMSPSPLCDEILGRVKNFKPNDYLLMTIVKNA